MQPERENELFKINISDDIYSLLHVSAIDVSEENGMEEESRTELDSHANMPVVGRNAYVISEE